LVGAGGVGRACGDGGGDASFVGGDTDDDDDDGDDDDDDDDDDDGDDGDGGGGGVINEVFKVTVMGHCSVIPRPSSLKEDDDETEELAEVVPFLVATGAAASRKSLKSNVSRHSATDSTRTVEPPPPPPPPAAAAAAAAAASVPVTREGGCKRMLLPPMR